MILDNEEPLCSFLGGWLHGCELLPPSFSEEAQPGSSEWDLHEVTVSPHSPLNLNLWFNLGGHSPRVVPWPRHGHHSSWLPRQSQRPFPGPGLPSAYLLSLLPAQQKEGLWRNMISFPRKKPVINRGFLGRTFCLLLSLPLFHLTYFIRMKCLNEHRIAADPSCTSMLRTRLPTPIKLYSYSLWLGASFRSTPPRQEKHWQETHGLPVDRNGSEKHPKPLSMLLKSLRRKGGRRGREGRRRQTVSTWECGSACGVGTGVCTPVCVHLYAWVSGLSSCVMTWNPLCVC